MITQAPKHSVSLPPMEQCLLLSVYHRVRNISTISGLHIIRISIAWLCQDLNTMPAWKSVKLHIHPPITPTFSTSWHKEGKIIHAELPNMAVILRAVLCGTYQLRTQRKLVGVHGGCTKDFDAYWLVVRFRQENYSSLRKNSGFGWINTPSSHFQNLNKTKFFSKA